MSSIPSGLAAGDALQHTLDLARHAEEIGLTRYWLAEHHNAAGVASASPEILICRIASATSRLRVGSGGMMLPNHSPLKLAEVFRLLHALFPGRIDLGLGRATGTDKRTAGRLQRTGNPSTGDEFPEQVDELTGYLAVETAERTAWSATTVAVPTGVAPPDLWILGSGESGASLAAERGLGFAFAHHFNPEDAMAMLRAYRAKFQPSASRAQPEAILAVSVVCAETDREAQRLATSAELGAVRFAHGYRDSPLPTVEEAQSHAYDDDEKSLRSLHRLRQIVGSPDEVAGRLRELCAASQAAEVMVQTLVHDQAARRRSYTLLAEALGVKPG
jgi:luciferase family oxidoreductase group 1